MGVSRQEAKELIDGYFETYPQVKEYMNKSIQVAREQGYVETIFHRKRFLPDINSRNGVVRGYAERNTINAPIQGSAADIIKVAMAHIYQRFQAYNLKAKMILQVHDELNFSVPEAEKSLYRNRNRGDGAGISHARTPESRLWVGRELVAGTLNHPITLFNLQSESNRSNPFEIQFAHQNIRQPHCRIFFVHLSCQKKAYRIPHY